MVKTETQLRRAAYLKAYNATPEAKAQKKAYNATPEAKARRKAYSTTPEAKAQWKAYNASPKGKAIQKVANVKRSFGITLEEYNQRLATQGDSCGNINCSTKMSTTARGASLDHCHTTGMLRDFLCPSCNLALGHAKDSSHILRGLANYLEKHHA